MIYLIYPYRHPQTGRHTAAPWSIGWNLAAGLRRRGYQVTQYDWDQSGCVYPDSPDDILIGHPHPDPGRMFRSSVCAPWKRVVSIAPWNGSEEYRAQQEYAWEHVDAHLAICGPYWGDKIPELCPPATLARIPIRAIDLAIAPQDFPVIPRTFNPPGQRRILYAGCTVGHKGTDFLEQIIARGICEVGHVGFGLVKGSMEHGYIDLCSDTGRELLARYDAIIAPGRNDANPTTILEAMCWGLVPLWTYESGWGDDVKGGTFPYGNLDEATKILQSFQNAPESALQGVIQKNRERAISFYTWTRFCDTVASVL